MKLSELRKKTKRAKTEQPLREPFYVRLGELIREVRQRRGLTLRELSRKIKMDETQLSRVETGSVRIKLVDFVAVAKALDVPPEDLLFEADGRVVPDAKRPRKP